MNLTYAATGVDYDKLDPFKRMAQLAATETKGNINRIGAGDFLEYTASRGESAFLIETPIGYLAHVEEGLGTKNLVADEMYRLTGKSYYDQIAQCTVAMIVNDMITLGALPLSVAMHLAVGDSEWFNDEDRSRDLIQGWKSACDAARAIWGGGETPTLKGVVNPGAVVLSGSAIGVVTPKRRLIRSAIMEGDVIVMIESSGIHANGLTLARKIAAELPEGYLTPLSDGRSYGDSLLDPTHIYVDVVEDCLDANIDIHYAVNVTGHGWRKLMRATEAFTYVITTLPTQLPIFDFIQEHGPVDNYEAYANLNMGAGFALIVSREQAEQVISIAENNKKRAFVAGRVEAGDKKVVILPKQILFEGESLAVR